MGSWRASAPEPSTRLTTSGAQKGMGVEIEMLPHCLIKYMQDTFAPCN